MYLDIRLLLQLQVKETICSKSNSVNANRTKKEFVSKANVAQRTV